MCESTERGRQPGIGRGLAAGLIVLAGAAVGGCFRDDAQVHNCPNLPIANGVVGQFDFDSGEPNTGGSVGRRTLSGALGSVATNGTLTYLADTANNRILGYFSPPIGIGARPDFELGQGDASGTDFTGNAAGIGLTSFSAPAKVTVSTDDRLVVADTGNNRVLIWNSLPTSNLPPDVVVGQPDFNSFQANQKLSAPTASTLSGPTAATIANGMLLVADRENHRILIWEAVPSAANTPANVELGQAAMRTVDDKTETCDSNTGPTAFCFTTSVAAADTPAADSKPTVLALSSPSDLWTDGHRLLVTDTANNRVLYWSGIPFVNDALYSHFIGKAQPSEGGPVIDNAHLDQPWGVYSNGSTFYVGDTAHNRVLAFSGLPVTDGVGASGVFGQADFTHVAANDNDQNGTDGSQQDGENSFAPTFNTLRNPTSVSTFGSNVYVADYGNHRVMIFPASAAVNGTTPSNCNGTNPELE